MTALKVSPRELRHWREDAEEALKRSPHASVELLKQLPKKRSAWRPAPPRVGEQLRLDEEDTCSPHGVVVRACFGEARLVLDAQDVLDWLDARDER